MKILYIGSKIPIPTHDGGSYASLQFIKQLSQLCSLNGLFIETPKHPLNKQAAERLQPYFHQLEFQKINTSISFWGVVKHLVLGKNYNLNRFRSIDLEEKIRLLIEQSSYKFIIADSLYAAAQLTGISNLPPIIVRAHNIEHEIWKKQSEAAKNPIKRWYLKQLFRSLKTEEISIFHKSESIWTMSEKDQQWIFKHLPQKEALLVPIAMEEQQRIEQIQPGIFHLGSADWAPNIQAIDYLVNELSSDDRLETIPVHLAGKGMESYTVSARNIENHGFVEDLSEFYKKAGILVTPIFSGSGIRVKILEALSFGVPVITTTLGAAGIDIEKSGILIAENKEQFIQHILALVQNDEERNRRGALGYTYVRKEHSFELVKQRMSHAIEQ